MAEIRYTTQEVDFEKSYTYIVTWPNMANGDYGKGFRMPRAADRSVQVYGTFGSGGSVSIQGTNVVVAGSKDGIEYVALTDPQGNNLALTSAKIEAVTEVVLFIRPIVTAGDGTTNLTVSMIVRRNE